MDQASSTGRHPSGSCSTTKATGKPARYFTSTPTEFRILDYVQSEAARSVASSRKASILCDQNDHQNGDNLAICVEEPRKYICWREALKEMIRKRSGVQLGEEVRMSFRKNACPTSIDAPRGWNPGDCGTGIHCTSSAISLEFQAPWQAVRSPLPRIRRAPPRYLRRYVRFCGGGHQLAGNLATGFGYAECRHVIADRRTCQRRDVPD